ncbi:MAG TPA: hypothetical protein VFE26_07265 [Trebonia sp.]|nr:hypothetical protein [Trebonia sp.]
MSGLVLDAGALIAIDRDDRAVLSRIQAAKEKNQPIRTNAMALAQVWRDGRGRQANLAKALHDIVVEPVPAEDGRRAGELLGATRLKDAIDASVALLVGPGDRVLTSDPGDLRRLCDVAGNGAVVVDC